MRWGSLLIGWSDLVLYYISEKRLKREFLKGVQEGLKRVTGFVHFIFSPPEALNHMFISLHYFYLFHGCNCRFCGKSRESGSKT